jgi:exopolysaccharide biosynthesis polyprenyl glycosylphosphotransferase
VDTKPVLPDRPSAPPEPSRPPQDDIRAARPVFLQRGWQRAVLRRVGSIAALMALDVGGLALGLYLALVVRELVFNGTDILWNLLWEGPKTWLKFLAPVTVLVFWQAGLYATRERRPGPGAVARSLVLVALIVLAFGLGTDYDFCTYGLIPTATVTCALTIGLLRAAYESFSRELLRAAGVRRRAVLVGEGEALARLHATLGSARAGIGYEFMGAVSRTGAPGLPQLGPPEDLSEVLRRLKPDELVLAEADLDERTVLDVVETAHRSGVRVRIAPTTTELLVQRGEYIPGQGAPLFELRPPVFTGADWALKRAFDLVVSVLVVVLGLPFWLLIAAAIKLDSRGPVLYRDRRVGVGEREFGMVKFRTMVAGADRLQDELEEHNEAEGALFKIRDDPRVTRVGAALRRLSLDELPQVLNVLRGEMSLVGPRPLPLRDYRMLEDWHRQRYLVLPGITGLWQISGRSNLSFDDLVRLDFYYLENWSIWLDVAILVKTIPAVLGRRGAY